MWASTSVNITWSPNYLRIYWVAASKSVRTRINLSDFTAQHHSVTGMCFPPSTVLSGNVFENYGETKWVGGSASGLTIDFAVVTF